MLLTPAQNKTKIVWIETELFFFFFNPGIGHNLSLICQLTSEDIKHQLIDLAPKYAHKHETQPPRVKKMSSVSIQTIVVSIQTIVVLFVLV